MVKLWIPLIILAFLIILTAVQSLKKLIARRKIIRQNRCEPCPALRQRNHFWGIGHVFCQVFDLPVDDSRNTCLKKNFAELGHTYQTFEYGRTVISTISPHNIQAVYASDFESYGVAPSRHAPLKPLLGDGIITNDGALWKYLRAAAAPIIAKTQIADLASFDVHVERFLQLVPQDGSTVDLQPLFDRLSLDSSTEFLFGESVNSLALNTSPEALEFLAAWNNAQQCVDRRIGLPSWKRFLMSDEKYRQYCKVAHQFVDAKVQSAILQCAHPLAEKVQRFSIAHELAKVTDNEMLIRQEVLQMFLPTHDAIATPLSTIFFHLARQPTIWTKLQEEVSTLGSDELTQRRLKGLRYLQAIMKEAFRLHPGLASNIRTALRDTVLPTGGGASGQAPIFVAEGDHIRISLYALQRQKDIWGKDAEEFRPERWETMKPSHWTYLPFGGGPRFCPGYELGMAQTAYAIVRILQVFKGIENRDPVDEFVDENRIVTVSKNGTKVALFP